MSWKVWVLSGETFDGRVQVPAQTFPWARSMNTGEGGSASFHLGDPRVAEVVGLQSLYPGRKLLVAEHNDKIIYAGFINDHDYDRDSLELSVSHADIWWRLERLKVLGDRSDAAARQKLDFKNLSLGTLAKRMVQAGINGLPANKYHLPIVFPPDTAGTESRTVFGYEMASVASKLTELIETEDGPNIDFQPRWTADFGIEWVMRIGDLATKKWEWNFDAASPGAFGLKVKTNVDNVANKVYGLGEGSEVDSHLFVTDDLATSTFPALERVDSFSDARTPAELRARTRESHRGQNQGINQIGFSILADGAIPVEELVVGGIAHWGITTDPYISKGWRNWPVIKFSGSLGNTVALDFQDLER